MNLETSYMAYTALMFAVGVLGLVFAGLVVALPFYVYAINAKLGRIEKLLAARRD